MTAHNYGLPDFSSVSPHTIAHTVRHLLDEHRVLLDAVGESAEPATIENTLVPLETGDAELSRHIRVMWTYASSVGGSEWDRVESELVPLLTAHEDSIYMDPRLYGRLEQLSSQEHDPQTAWALSEHLKNFRSRGVHLDTEFRERLQQINARMADLKTQIGQLIVKTNGEAALPLGEDDVVGLTDSQKAGLAADAAANPDAAKGAPYLLTMVLPTQQPLAASFAKAKVRERVLEASIRRADGHGGGVDTRALILELVKLRAEQANILGFETFAEYEASRGTAGSSRAVFELLDSMVGPTATNAEKEASELAEHYRDHLAQPGEEFSPADWTYTQEHLRQSAFSLDGSELSRYLELWNVVERGVFYAATRLYGLQFIARDDLSGYTEDVKVWEVREEDGSRIGLFLGDYYARAGKRGGAWMHELLIRSEQGDDYTIICNNLNVTKPAEGSPTLLTWDEVRTCFHEFGHALHGFLSATRWPSAAGTNVPRDFVEFPSQVNEMWASHPEVLDSYARHFETGETMPDRLRGALTASEGFAEGFATSEILQAVLLDQAWHRVSADEIPSGVEAVASFESAALTRIGIASPWIPPRYRTTYFDHIFSSDYSAGYYSYLWSEALDADVVAWFRTEGARGDDGGLNRTAGETMRCAVLSRGNSRNPVESFEELRGRPVDTAALLRRRRLV